MTAPSLTIAQQARSLWKEYEDESYRWLALLITSKAVSAQISHYAQTFELYAQFRNVIENQNVSESAATEDVRYNKIRSLFERITYQQCARNRSIQDLRRIADVLRSALNRLENILPKEKLVQYVKLSYIEGLLDETTLNQWKHASPVGATYLNLMEFIDSRCSSVFQLPTQPPTCVFCPYNRHWPYKCEIFRLLAMPERIAYVRRHKVCVNCFSEIHNSDECILPPCPRCSSGKLKLYHNSALCAENTSIVDAAAAKEIDLSKLYC